MRRALPAMLVAAALTAGGCGTTTIIANDHDAHIYVGGRLVGKGQGTVRRRGFPGSTDIIVKTADGRRATAHMRRRFTATTLVFGLFTYMIGWVADWEYPDAVYVEVEPPPSEKKPSGWDSGDEWNQPPPGWQPPQTAAPGAGGYAPAPPPPAPPPPPPPPAADPWSSPPPPHAP